jgi:phosphate transport system substrate-binding protein
LGNSQDKTLFSQDTLLLPSSEGIMAEVRQNPNAIGYDGLGYITPDVKTLAIAPDADGEYVKPSSTTVNNGKYPIARPLFMYTNDEPQGDVKIYLDWVLGPAGQKIVGDLGFVPLQ